MTVPCANPLVVFDRVTVDFLVAQAGARVFWFISDHFNAPEPWTFQLQVAESDLPQANWTNTGTPVQNTCFTTDPNAQGQFGKGYNVFYRVILTDANNMQYVSPVATVYGNLDFRSHNFARELVRKELVRLGALMVGVEGWLLKIKRSGTQCPCCLDQYTGEVINSNCECCYGSRWLGGYYAPQPMVYTDITAESRYYQRATEDGMGMVNPQSVKGMFVALPYLSTMDVWVNNSSDVRFHIHQVQPRTYIRDVPILVVAELRPIPHDNVVYKFPIPRTYPGCPIPGC